eukprot:1334930-Prymnesium_polylepis.1
MAQRGFPRSSRRRGCHPCSCARPDTALDCSTGAGTPTGWTRASSPVRAGATRGVAVVLVDLADAALEAGGARVGSGGASRALGATCAAGLRA